MQLNVRGSFALYKNVCKQTNKQKKILKNERKGWRGRGRKEGRVGAGKANSNIGKLSQNHGKLVKYSSFSFLFFSKQKKNHKEKKQLGWGSVSLQYLFRMASIPRLDPSVQKTAKQMSQIPNQKPI